MDISRRDFLRHAAALAAGTAAPATIGAPGAGGNKPLLVALPLTRATFSVDAGPLAGADRTITDYSGFGYCPPQDAALFFGGGHAATAEDVVLRYGFDKLQWIADYSATPLPTMQQLDGDGSPRYLTAGKFWQVPGEVPPLRPVARHTYTGFLWSSAIERMVLVCNNNGASYGLSPQTVGGNVAEYDPSTRTWTDTGCAASKAAVAYCEDPVSGNILAQDAYGLRVYDPRARQWLGVPLVTVAGMSYAENLVYYPPNDRFYYIGLAVDSVTGTVRVWEYALDRTTFRPNFTNVVSGKPVPMTTNWRPSPAGDKSTRFVYDRANQLIVGGLIPGLMFAFKPLPDGTGQWLQHPAPGTAKTIFYCHAYAERTNTHLVLCDFGKLGRRTIAFRWDPNAAQVAVDTRGDQPPPAKITVGGVAVATLQQACNAGGEIAVGAGELRGGIACATIGRPVRIVGQDSALTAAGIEGKGILIVSADARFEGLEISGADVSDGNGAAIRHQGGNVVLNKVKLHHNQNGILGPASPQPYSLDMSDCEVHHNGTGTGQTHGVYIGKIDRFTCVKSRFYATRIGHHIKSRARETLVQGCEVGTDFDGNESYNIDIPVGGDATVTDCTLRQGPKTDNKVMLNYGSEAGPYPDGTLKVYRCVFESTAGGTGIRNALPGVVADVQDCDFNGVTTPVEGNHTRRNCRANGVPLQNIG